MKMNLPITACVILAVTSIAHLILVTPLTYQPPTPLACCCDHSLALPTNNPCMLPEPMIVEESDIEQELGPEALIGDGPASAMEPKPYKKNQ